MALTTGCTSNGSRDKAGGNGGSLAPTTLTLATADPDQRDIGEFVTAVARLSHGSMRIDVVGAHPKDVSYEKDLIADLRAGRYDMAQVGARAFDLDGVTTLDPLVAPFVVRSPAEEQRVLMDRAVTQRLLAGLHRLDLVGVALIPGDIRYLLGVTRPLRTIGDLRGARIGIRPSVLAAATMRALGAKPAGFVAGGTLYGLAGAEQDLPTIVGNGYDRQAKSVTINLPLWPRSQVVAMAAASYSRLSSREHSILSRAARSVVGPATRRIEIAAREAYGTLCAEPHFQVTRTDANDVALIIRRASRATTALARDPLAGPLLRAVRRAVSTTRDERPLPRCRKEPPVSAAHTATAIPAGLTGAWLANVSRSRYYAAGPLPGENNEANWGPQSLTLRSNGTFALRDLRFPATTLDGEPIKGSFRVRGPELDLTPRATTPAPQGGGETWRYRWSLFHGTLTLRRGPGGQPTALIAAPFTKR